MRTPEEIKKGLECCIQNSEEACYLCPYMIDCETFDNAGNHSRDALAYINQLEARVPKWISVKDRLPENYEPVIIFQDNCRNACYGWMIDGRWSVPKWVAVTHWMPLPKMPNEE